MMRQIAGAFHQYEKARLVAKLKAALERDSAAYGPKPPGSVGDACEVSVKTVQQEVEVKGCSVWCVPVAWEDTPERYIRFERQSSPTSKGLQPGYYLFWAEYNGTQGKRTPLEVLRYSVVDIPAP